MFSSKEILYYFIIINIIGFIFMFLDKGRAIKGKYRIPEKTLIINGVIGGSLGILLGMYILRHKTKKNKFRFGIPIIIIIQIFLVYWLKLVQ